MPVLALTHNGQAVTIVIYGQPDETGRLTLFLNNGIAQNSLDSASKNFTVDLPDKNHLNLKIKIPANGVAEFKLNQPDHLIRILAINRNLSLVHMDFGRNKP